MSALDIIAATFAVIAGVAVSVAFLAWITVLPSIGLLWAIGWLR